MIVMDTLEDRYLRQQMLPEIGPEGQAKIAAAKVLVVGVGGLGSPISIYLAAAGVGTLGLVDSDAVSVTNLHRQILYDEHEVGASKALCAKQKLSKLNSTIQVMAFDEKLNPDNAEKLISQFDIVVDGTDNFASRFLINDTCIRLGKPYVYGAICGFEGQVSVFTSRCDYRTLFPDEEQARQLQPSKAVIGITPAIVGSFEVGEVLKLICGYGEPLIGKLLVIDIKTLQINTVSIV